MNFNSVPVRQWKHREFDSPDPWAAGRPTRWSIVAFRLVPQSLVDRAARDPQPVPSESNAIHKRYFIGICAEDGGRYRILPSALAQSWRARQVQDHDLPRLLYQGEDRLRRKNDSPGPLAGRPLLRANLIAVVALAIFACYLRLLIQSAWQ